MQLLASLDTEALKHKEKCSDLRKETLEITRIVTIALDCDEGEWSWETAVIHVGFRSLMAK